MLLKTPLVTGEVKLSSNTTDLWWKQILPRRKIDYHGRTLDFNDEYYNNIINAYKDNALGEQTAFQLADDDNSHETDEDREKKRNFSPERYRGEIVDFDIREDGLWGQLKPTSEGNKLLTDNQKLGVSAMLEEGYVSKHTGKVYPVVMRHLLGTLNPHIKGMGNWEKAQVALSSEDDKNKEVIDLTSTEPDKKNEGNDETVAVPKDKWDEMQSYFAQMQEEDEALKNLMNEPDENFDLEDDDDDENVEEDDRQLVGLSDKDRAEFNNMRNKLAASEFDREADQWRRQGVPNGMIELARPALSSGMDSTVITLSSGGTKDPKSIIREILNEAKGTIDLSEQSTHSLSDDEKNAEEANKNDAVSYFTGLGNHF